MINRANDVLPRRVLVVDGSLPHPDTAHEQAINGLVEEFARRGVVVITSVSFEDGEAVVTSDAGLGAVIVDWDLDADKSASHQAAAQMLRTIRDRNTGLPGFQRLGLVIRDDSRSGVGGRWKVTIAARPHIQ